VPVRFSKAQADERASDWKNISPERISLGEQLYIVNCQSCHAQGGTDQVLARFSKGQTKLGATPLQVYSSIRKGFDGQHRLDYFPEETKWAMIAYLRSRSPNPPDDSSSDWKRFLKEGLY
jgi:mono/diheme cytochrome c family protein